MIENISLKSPQIRCNLDIVQGQIHESALAAGRDPETIELIVVTKNQPAEYIANLLELGVRKLGENYAEEALTKMRLPDIRQFSDIEWHMIGHIQSRKARIVGEYFAYVHSLDSVKLARRLDRFAGEVGRKLPIYIQCNVSGEETKFGFDIWDKEQLGEFLEDVATIITFQNLEVVGLMTMPPFTPNAEDSRSYFIALRNLKDVLRHNFPSGNWSGLSMGMSHDYIVAIQEGATVVRIGEAILGPRG